MGNESEVQRMTETRSLRPFRDATASLHAEGLVDVLKHGDKVVGYQIRADVYDWLTHPSRPPVPERLGGPIRTPGDDHDGHDAGAADDDPFG